MVRAEGEPGLQHCCSFLLLTSQPPHILVMQLEKQFALGLSNEKLPQKIKVPLQKHLVETQPVSCIQCFLNTEKK